MKEEHQADFVSVQTKLREDVSLQVRDLNRSHQQLEVWLQGAVTGEVAARGAELRKVEQKQSADLETTGRQFSEICARLDGLGEKSREVWPMLELKASQTKVLDLERLLQGLYTATETGMAELVDKVETGKVERILMKEEQEAYFVSMRTKLKEDMSLQARDLNRSHQELEAWLQGAVTGEVAARGAELRKVEQKQSADLEATGRQLSEICARLDD